MFTVFGGGLPPEWLLHFPTATERRREQHQSPHHQSLGTKLNCEQLESREVPALYWWSPGSTNILASNPANWLVGSGTPYAQATQAPDWDDHLYFDSGVSDDDCDIPLWANPGESPPPPPPPGAPDFAGIHLVNEYAGTVNVKRSPTVGMLVLASADGAIAQNDPATYSAGSGGTLTVTSELDWTAGTLNSGSLPGVVALAATATGTAAPNGETLNLGSTLKLLGNSTTQTGSTLEVNDGTFTLTNNQIGFHATEFAALTFALGAPVPKQYATDGIIDIKDNTSGSNDPSKVTIDAGATATIKVKEGAQPGYPQAKLTGYKPWVENNGTLVLKDKAELKFNPDGTRGGAPATGTGGGLIQDETDAVTSIASGSKITCGKKTNVLIKKGKVSLADRPDVTDRTTVQLPVTIASPDEEKAAHTLELWGAGKLTHTTNDKGLLRLVVEGNFRTWGTVTMVFSRVASASDKLEVTGTVDFIQGSHLDVWWYAEVGTSLPSGWYTPVTSSYGGTDRDPIIENLGLRQVNPGTYGITLWEELSEYETTLYVNIV